MGIAIIIPNVDFSDSNLGQVTIVENKPLISLSISGEDSISNENNQSTYNVEYNPTNTNERGVIWSITEGNQYATINQQGVVSVLGTGSVTIKATSKVYDSISATKNISVTYKSEFEIEYNLKEFTEQIDTGQNLFSPGYGDWTLIVKSIHDSTMKKEIFSALKTPKNTVLSISYILFNNSQNSYPSYEQKFLTSHSESSLWAKSTYLCPDDWRNNPQKDSRYVEDFPFAYRLKDGIFSCTKDGKVWLSNLDVSSYLTESDTQLSINIGWKGTVLLSRKAMDDVSKYLE